jgi:hypothetical protein
VESRSDVPALRLPDPLPLPLPFALALPPPHVRHAVRVIARGRAGARRNP